MLAACYKSYSRHTIRDLYAKLEIKGTYTSLDYLLANFLSTPCIFKQLSLFSTPQMLIRFCFILNLACHCVLKKLPPRLKKTPAKLDHAEVQILLDCIIVLNIHCSVTPLVLTLTTAQR